MPKHKKNNKNNRDRDNSMRGEETYQKIILDFLGKFPKNAFGLKEISDATDLYHVVNIQKIRSVLKRLSETGQIILEGKNRYKLGAKPLDIVGKIEVTRGGMGFFLQEDKEDVFVPQRNLGSALNGDIVKIRLSFSHKDGKKIGEVIEVVQRARNEFVGTILREPNGLFFVKPDDPTVSVDFIVRKHHMHQANPGDKVQVRIENWERRNPEAVVIEVLGKAGEHHTEMHAILLNYGFQPQFDAEVEAFAEAIPDTITPEEVARRRDFRDVLTFTIDPADAKDFDDAISFRVLENGRYEVGVHIADVSHYLKPGTILDMEAFKRATSVYLVDRTIPMLPERLSNFLCSLRPHEDKLTYSAVFELDIEGKIYAEWFGRTIIHSAHRFSYEEAQSVLEGVTDTPFPTELGVLNTIAKNLRATRMQMGSVDFDTDEVRFELDADNKPVRLYIKERKDAHKLIEDFMLLANRRVATVVAKMFTPPLSFVYRIHDRPTPEKLSDLQLFIEHFGYKMNLSDAQDPSAVLGNLMKQIEGKPEQNIIEKIAIRSMAKAVYSTENVGHFGLGFEFYSHFTSPIRRYPDVLVHRLLDQYLQKDYSSNVQRLQAECEHCSKLEKTAAEAERASIKYKQVEFLASQIGKEFEGVISGVKESGFYVEMPDTLCEGMVPLWTISDDYYHYDEKRLTLTGKHSGRVFRMGDRVRVIISKTDLQRRIVDLQWVNA